MLYLLAILLLTIFLALIFTARKLFFRFHVNNFKQAYIKKDDPTAQKNYDEKFSKKILYNIKEKIELSWEFLYSITELVLNQFSNEDREAVHQIGAELVDNGMKYDHVVEYGLQINHLQNRNVANTDQSKLTNTQVQR